MLYSKQYVKIFPKITFYKCRTSFGLLIYTFVIFWLPKKCLFSSLILKITEWVVYYYSLDHGRLFNRLYNLPLYKLIKIIILYRNYINYIMRFFTKLFFFTSQ